MEREIIEKGREILAASKGESMAIFKRDYWNGKLMDWSMKNPAFKTDLFRFVDVLPVLNEHTQIANHLQEYFCRDNKELPGVLKSAISGMGAFSFTSKIAANTIKKNITQMASMFITGSNPAEAFPVLDGLRKNDLCFTVDLLGEAAVSEEEALDYQSKYIELIHQLSDKAKSWSDHPLLDFDHKGPIPKVNVSVKMSSLYSQISTADFDRTLTVLKDRLRPVFQAAMKTGSFLNLDMEQFALKDLTYAVFTSLLDEPEFRTYPHFGVVVQAYLKSAQADLENLVAWAKRGRRQITVRLVKGAYWDYEVVYAQQMHWPIPVFTTKSHSDANYEVLTRILFENHEHTRPALGSHNIRSLAHAFVLADQMKLSKKMFEVQMLYGMAEPFKAAVTRLGYRCRDYAPVGEMLPGMAYLVRRLLENTSNEGFLRLKFTTDTPLEVLMRTPESADAEKKQKPNTEGELTLDARLDRPYVTAPLLDLGDAPVRNAFAKSITEIEKKLGQRIPLRINGKSITTEKTTLSINPCRPEQVVAVASSASAQEALTALDFAYQARHSWAHTPVRERAKILLKAADILKRRRIEIATWEIFETAKAAKEADADVVEAIDFCEYYARHAVELSLGKKLFKVPGEDNTYHYRPKGVGLVIAPWNFPLAIPVGMVSAALVAGNPVVFKPSEQSVRMGEILYEVFMEAGVPPEVLHLVPGRGSQIGPALIQSPRTAFVIFTGSMEVGIQIIEGAAKLQVGQQLVKKVVAEMGGKNALIIDEDADLDEAVVGALYSAFGFQGQKCSACSRLIVHEAIYDRFMARLRAAIPHLRVGEAKDLGVYLSAVIDESAFKRISGIISDTLPYAKKITQGKLNAGVDPKGFYILPTLLEDLPADAPAAKEEIFGPVVCAFKASSIQDAVNIANNCDFALTGGVYSRSPSNIEFVKKHMEAGNIYINRGITGAIVGRHPFGGYKLSGVGSKAGGPDYLLQFMDPVTIVENTMRRGFSPDIEN